ncbi:MAG: helix-turn-helix transcriptional regulator [Oscillospiraceae bacterium]|nr:helix-turn-helix transcriptional regulator [Oscillospiraceae bacterium]MBQ8586969.1 helix-turn-helix transcriptional regulator [Oscillospiraceae bacterium]
MDRHYKEYIQIGLNIMRCRKEQGLTQEQLAEMTGYSRNHIQRVETAASKPTVGLLLDLSAALDVPVEQLLEIRRK